MKKLKIRHRREILPIGVIGLMLFVLLSGRQQCDFFRTKSFATPNEEFFKQNTESCFEPDSGTDKSNIKATAAFMIGLPF